MTLSAAVFIATSLDGYIACPDGAIDWLEAANASVPPGEDCGYAAFMDSVDALVMGRNTFERVLGFPEWPYGDKRVVVQSSRPLFGALEADIALELLSSRAYPFGFVQSSYRVKRA